MVLLSIVFYQCEALPGQPCWMKLCKSYFVFTVVVVVVVSSGTAANVVAVVVCRFYYLTSTLIFVITY